MLYYYERTIIVVENHIARDSSTRRSMKYLKLWFLSLKCITASRKMVPLLFFASTPPPLSIVKWHFLEWLLIFEKRMDSIRKKTAVLRCFASGQCIHISRKFSTSGKHFTAPLRTCRQKATSFLFEGPRNRLKGHYFETIDNIYRVAS